MRRHPIAAVAIVTATIAVGVAVWLLWPTAAPAPTAAAPALADVDPTTVIPNPEATPPADNLKGEGGRAPVKTTEPSIADIELAGATSESDLAALGRELGFTVRHYLPQIGYAAIESTDGGDIPASTLSAIVERGLGRSAAPTGWAHVVSTTPTDPRYSEQWGFGNTGQTGGVAGVDMATQDAWDWSRGDDFVVAVIDEGVMDSHPDLAEQMWANPDEVAGNGIDDDGNGFIDDVHGWDFVNDDATTYDMADGDGHGTHVAGTIAASTNNGAGGAGAAWNTKIMSVKALGIGGGAYADLAAAIVYAVDNGAKVSNNSWGGTYNDGSVAAAVAYAASHSHLMVCAAGNDAVNTDTTAFYPSGYTNSNIISVAAHDASGNLSSFSNYGATSVDIAAPGSSILSTRARSSAGVRVSNRTATGGTAPYSLYYYPFPVELLGSAAQTATRNTLIDTAITSLAPATSTSVLVVNDSWNYYGDFTSVYTGRLSALGYNNVTTKVTWSGTTSIAPSISGYGLVIWYTNLTGFENFGTISKMTLNSGERTVVGNYLKAGGKMLLVSSELAEDLTQWSDASWLHEYTQAALFNNTHQNAFQGVAGGPFAGMTGTTPDWLTAGAGYPADYLSYLVGDALAPLSGASPLLYWSSEYFNLNGTSMAAPHVTGAVALAWARTPAATMSDIRSRVLDTATPMSSLTGKCVTGGRLNAAGAVGELAPPTTLAAAPTSMSSMTVSWSNDTTDAYFDHTRVLARLGEVPTSSTDGSATVIYDGTAQSADVTSLASGTWYLAAYSYNALGSESVASTATVALGEPLVQSPSGPLADTIQLTFPLWSEEGSVYATPTPLPQREPSGLRLLPGSCYEISTSVTYSGSITIRLAYDPGTLTLAQQRNLKMYHWVGGAWVDVTDSVDTEAHVVVGTATSLSPFAIMYEPSSADLVSVPASGAWSTAALAAVGASLTAVGVRRRRRALAQNR